MQQIQIYNEDSERLNEAAAKISESTATIIKWLIEENLDDLVKEVSGIND